MFHPLFAFLSTDSFMPHGHCYLWQPSLLFLQVTTNLLIGLAYVSIASTLAYLVHRVDDIPFRWVYVCFCVFIISCGFTHFFNIYVIWNPEYWWDAAIRTVTAVASVGTALLLFPLIPKALALAKGASEAHQRGIKLESMVRDLGTMYEKSRELDELKTQFFANVSHELRTPLALIQTPAEKLLEADNLTDEQRKDVEVILRNSGTVLRQVNDLLDVATTEAGAMKLEYADIDAADLLRRVTANFEVLAQDRDIDFVIEADDELRAQLDIDKVERILLNLLSNAFKFTPDGGTVRSTISTREVEFADESDSRRGRRKKTTTQTMLAIEIADSGPGIAPEQRHLVFERFQQLEGGKTRRFGGTGLGLAIVREFVELLRGSIGIGTAPEGGALFTALIPLKAPPHIEIKAPGDDRPSRDLGHQVVEDLRPSTRSEESPAEEPPAQDETKPQVLVVEDNRDMNHYIAESLSDDFQIVTAFNGRQGLELAEKYQPDLIVTDIMMPEMSGDQMIAEIHSRPEFKFTPIIVLTAKADAELRVDLLERGAMDYINKPFSSNELSARANNLVALKRTGDLLREQLQLETTNVEELARKLANQSEQLEIALDAANVAGEQASQASQVKSNFLALVSHELRTPLASIKLYVDILQRNRESLNDDQIDILDRVTNNVQRLTNIVESLLQQASFESGRVAVEAEPFDLESLVRETLELYRDQAAKRNLDLRFQDSEVLPIFDSDARLIRLAVGNLITNAIKFTQEGFIELSLEFDADKKEYRINVKDTGPGIPSEERIRVFEPFEHLQKIRHKQIPGLGLGLALTHQIVQALGGRVEVQSEVGKGSVFSVVIPEHF